MSARRAVVRWSWRLFRREWRQQLLVLLLLTTTVAASIVGAAAAQNLAPDAAAEFGTGTHQLQLTVADPAELDTALGLIRTHFGEIDVIRSRRGAIPGSVNTVELRSQDPEGPFGAPRLALVSGRFPAGAGELAVTDDLAATLEVAAGDPLRLPDVEGLVVGIVENPANLDDEFVLVEPGDAGATAQTVLLDTTEDRIRSLPGQVRLVIAVRGQDESTVAAIVALGLAVVVAIFVCLVAAAGFVVLAQRRLRQLGMLAAIGATERHLRLVVLANGLTVGAVAAVAGAGLAWLGWIGLGGWLEGVAAHRIDRYALPWWIVASGMVIAVVTATAAAWWPGRVVAKVPVTRALSGRPPQPRQVHRSALAGLALLAAGFTGLAVGLDTVKDKADPRLILPGIAAVVIGMLLTSPLAIRVLSRVGRRAPISIRLALRDLVRHQARSGVALAAITLSLSLAVTTVVLAAANEDGPAEGNLSVSHVLARLGDRDEPILPALSTADLQQKQAAVEEFAASLGASALLLQEAITVDARETREGVVYHPSVVLGRPVDDGLRDIDRLYLATPQLLEHLGLDAGSFPAATDILTSYVGPLRFANARKSEAAPAIERIAKLAHSSAPTSLLMPGALERFGWEAAPTAWLIEAPQPLTPAQVASAREMALRVGLTVETRDQQDGLTSLKAWATAVGAGLALAILAMTIGLLRVESGGELLTLAAAGATSATRRGIVATTAGALAALGAILGTAGAYLALVAGYLEDLDPLSSPPAVHLAAIAVGVPLLAAGTAWLLAGREPATTDRAAMG